MGAMKFACKFACLLLLALPALAAPPLQAVIELPLILDGGGIGTVLTIRRNRFAHNVIGMYFYGEKGGHRISANRFENNLAQVVASAPGAGETNVWHDNYWSDYQGFDRNGDTPYELYAYADRIWMEIPQAKFFANAPALELLDFLERLAPFSLPALILRDDAPHMR